MNMLLAVTTDNGATAVGGIMAIIVLIAIVCGLLLAIVWTVFPFIVWAKFDEVLKQLRLLNAKQ